MKTIYTGLLTAIGIVGLSSLSWGQCFNPVVNFDVDGSPVAVVVADFNRDGKPDLATANQNSNSVSVLLNNGTGGFNSPNRFSVNGRPESIAVSDFDGDGKLDLFTFNLGDDLTSNSVSVLLNDGSGGFGPAIKVFGGPVTDAVTAGDFNGDGKSDLAFGFDFIHSVTGGAVVVKLGNGSGGFSNGPRYGSASYIPKSIATSDFNGDGKLDLVVMYATTKGITLHLGIGNGEFNYQYTYVNGGDNAVAMAIGDFNADSKPDLAVANSSNTVSILLNDGQGFFNPVVNLGYVINPTSIITGDFNLDGKLDVATANAGDNTVSVLQGNSTGLFSSIKLNFAVGTDPRSLAVGDFNIDGRPDLVTANANANTVSVLLNCTPTGLTLAPPTYDCTTSLLTLSTTGGNGAPIEYRIAGLRDWSASNTFTVPAYQRNGTSFTLEARQSGQVVNLPFTSACQSTTPTTPTSPTQPTGTNLSLVTPTYDCTSGQLTLATNGGNGAVVEYRVAGLRDWDATNTFTVPTYQRTGTTFTLEARQSGVAVSLPFTSACQSTTTTPPAGTALSVRAQSLNCQTGALQLVSSGGDGTPIEYKVPGLGDYSASATFTVPAYQRSNTTFTLYARQSGREVTASYAATCPVGSRVASPEIAGGFRVVVYPNPVGEQFSVGVSGASGQLVRFHLTTLSGQTVLEQRVPVNSDAHTETLRLPASGAGLYLLQVSTDSQNRTLKVLKP